MTNNLRKIRGKHQITVTELAKRIGVSKQGLSLNEKGKISPNVALKAAEVLHENVFEILGESAFVILPKTEEDKAALIKIIKEL